MREWNREREQIKISLPGTLKFKNTLHFSSKLVYQ